MEKGCHVLCEKPLTTSVKDAERIILKAQQCGKVLFPCHNYKHAPVIKTIREVIASGRIGKISAATISTYRNTHALGQEDWLPDWRRRSELSGGGIGMDHGFHSLYLLFEWLGDYPVSVTASGFNLIGGDFDTEDNFNAVYEFPNGLATVHLTWTAGVRKVIYTLQGEKGAITIDDDQMELALLKKENRKTSNHKASWQIEKSTIASNWMDSSHVNWFNSMFDKFKAAIYDNNILNEDIRDAYHCINSIMAAYKSIENCSKKVILENNFLQES
ncbi:MAG: Gfo/Idh/MocA family oxidoreductase [Alphaproteobacteria bacterium]|nr:Gfo/Idh/MocA family oxidoreductase [Alphaproteobacteria bacterium]